jgi:CheY-like chemotaxis protein
MEPYFLYVEDDEDDVVLLREMMRQTGFLSPFAVANNGFEAIRFLQDIKTGSTYPFMILLDIDMPRLNGGETLSLLKSDDMYCLIPVVMFSVATQPETIKYFASRGTEVLSKPIEFDDWKNTLQKISSFADF